MGLKNDKLIHFKAKLFTVDVSAKTQGHCRDLHGQQEQIQTAEVWGQGHQKCENWTPGLCQGIGCSLLLPLSCIGFQVKFLLKDRWREFMEKRRALGGWKKQNLSHKKNVRNLAKWMFRCLLRWDNLTDNLKPIYLFLFSSPTFTAFPHCLKKLWWDPSGGFGVGKPKSAVWEAVPITESDSGWSHSMHTSSKRARVSQSIHDLRGLMSPQAYIRDLVSPSRLNI